MAHFGQPKTLAAKAILEKRQELVAVTTVCAIASTTTIVAAVAVATVGLLATVPLLAEEDDENWCLETIFEPKPQENRRVIEPNDQEEAQPPICFIFGDIAVSMPWLSRLQNQDSISMQIWRGSLLTAAHLSRKLLEGASVLELGCGRALAGLVAAEMGAQRVVLTDCDDRALGLLLSNTKENSVSEVRHFLWESDEQREEIGSGHSAPRHWSDAHRNEQQIAILDEEETFDVILASDCLYFSSQELPLASVLRCRMRKPHGTALVCHQRRGDGSFLLTRLQESLEASEMHVEMQEGPWPWPELLAQHLLTTNYNLAYCPHDTGPHCMLRVTWN